MSPQQDNEMRQQQMTFSDQDTGYTYKIDDFVDDVRKSRDERIASYKDFLKRPIKLNAYKWQVGGAFDADINPWDDYFGNNTRYHNASKAPLSPSRKICRLAKVTSAPTG
jgi:hypothetical protein